MRVWRLLPVIFAAACAGDYIPVADFASKDFSVADAPVLEDFSPPGTSDGGDLAVGQDLGGHDLAAPVDLQMPDLQMPDLLMPDLTPAPMCDLMPADVDGGVHGLRLAGAAAAGAFATATFDGTSWSGFLTDSSHAFSDVAVGDVAIGRQTPTSGTSHDDKLDWVRIDPCSNAPTSQQIGVLVTGLRPSIAHSDVIFRGSFDANLYHTHWDGSVWSASSTQSMLTTNVEPIALFEGGALHVIFTGTNNTIYDGTISDAAGGGAAVQAGGGTSAYAPAAATAADGTVWMLFTGMDTNLYYSSRASGGSWTAAAKVCAPGTCLATSMKPPSVGIGASGVPILAYIGTDGHVYTSGWTGTKWSNPIAGSSGTDMTTLRPALAAGIGGAEAELVYVRAADGAPVHGRLMAGTWSFTALTGAAFQSAPALASW